MRALVKCTNLAVQNSRSLANWIFHGDYDSFARQCVKQLP